MNSVDLFLKTLKQIGYNEADYVDSSDFNTLISEKDLKPFFELFCTLNENNVLTTEEIEEYSALTSAELAEIEVIKKNEQFEKNDMELEKKKEAYFLKEKLAHLERHNKSLEKQIDLFKKHEENLLQDKEMQEKFLLSSKKRFRTYEMIKIPKLEEKFISNLQSTLEIAQDLESLIIHSDSNDTKLTTSNFFKDIVQEYLEVEEKILRCINAYMQTNFQLQDDTLSFICSEMLHNKELEKEVLFLKKLKSSMTDNIMSEIETYKIESMVKYFETAAVPDVNFLESQLRHKLDDVEKLNKQLKKKEEGNKAYLCDAISKYVDALVAEVALSATGETFNHFQFCAQKISLPKNYLLRQRLRVGKLISSLCEHKGEFLHLRELIQKTLKQIEEEQSYLQERKIQIEKELCAVTEKPTEQHHETILSLYKILATSDDFKAQNLSNISVEDVMQKINKHFEVEENLKEKQEENIKVIDLIESRALSLESLLCGDKTYSDWHQLEQSLNSNLNNLHEKLTLLERSQFECYQDLDQKQKLLGKKQNLQLARHLYVYALMNRDLFKKYIEGIKITIENSSDYKS